MPDGNTLFERTCRGERGQRMPVWIMRQAGRYLPEYRKVRETVDFLTATKTPELAAAITMQPMARFPLDAAILFSDIMTPLEGMGVALKFDPGPVLERPIRSAADVRKLRALDPEEATPFVLETLRLVRAELSKDRALIGFAGAPFTLFCYLVQGQGSRDFMEARSFLRGETETAVALMDLLGASTVDYLAAQADAGADAVMLFDSWVGLLGPDSYRRFVLPLMQSVVTRIRSRVDRPIIYFANGAGAMVDDIGRVGADVVGIDWTLPLSRAVDQLGPDAVVQGNLDPAALFAPPDELDTAIRSVIDEGSRAAGHIFNLGHGIHRTTDPDRVAFLVDRVHEYSAHT
ncbi:MAG TPA: uroporphyrinogen decarboxylase [Longimicrobiales bacterium]|nr:uroporphyrinogen decarboxylase [Longimicrobiales bacterium]